MTCRSFKGLHVYLFACPSQSLHLLLNLSSCNTNSILFQRCEALRSDTHDGAGDTQQRLGAHWTTFWSSQVSHSFKWFTNVKAYDLATRSRFLREFDTSEIHEHFSVVAVIACVWQEDWPHHALRRRLYSMPIFLNILAVVAVRKWDQRISILSAAWGLPKQESRTLWMQKHPVPSEEFWKCLAGK